MAKKRLTSIDRYNAWYNQEIKQDRWPFREDQQKRIVEFVEEIRNEKPKERKRKTITWQSKLKSSLVAMALRRLPVTIQRDRKLLLLTECLE